MPVRFIEISPGVLRRMIGMGVVEAHDFELHVASVTLHRDEFRRVDGISRFRRRMNVATWNRLQHVAVFAVAPSEQDSTTLIWIGVECVSP
jgi:hypothetical protein